ncbi:MAG: hypothetical protein WCX79_01550 [Candidatus Paceibacterota bacterium]
MLIIISRKMSLIEGEEFSFDFKERYQNPFNEDIKKVKFIVKKKTKKYIYLTLFSVLRFYIHSIKFFKKKSLELAKKIEEKLIKSQITDKNEEKEEIDRRLRIVSEYIEKIREVRKK